MEHFGRKMRELRKRAKVTQTDIEIRSNGEIKQSRVSDWEAMAEPPVEGMRRIAELLDLRLKIDFLPKDAKEDNKVLLTDQELELIENFQSLSEENQKFGLDFIKKLNK